MNHELQLEVPGQWSRISDAWDEVGDFLFGRNIPDHVTYAIRLGLEEVLSNILRHSANKGQIQILLSLDDNGVLVEIIDHGGPFNPLEYPSPDLDLPLEERNDSGLGLHMLRKTATNIEYFRDRDANILRIFYASE